MQERRALLRTALVSALTTLTALLRPEPAAAATGAAASPEIIAIIGTGNVGSALGVAFARAGHRVIYGSRHPDDDKVKALVTQSGARSSAETPAAAAAKANIILFAVPWWNAQDAAMSLGDLKGKVLIDTSNTVARDDNGKISGMVEVPTSAAQIIQAWLPQASVVKAFNAVSTKIMTDPSIAQGPVTVPLAGNDTAAKARVVKLIQTIGFEAYDTGLIANARVLEAMARLYTNVQVQDRPDGFDFYFRVHPRLYPLDVQRRLNQGPEEQRGRP